MTVEDITKELAFDLKNIDLFASWPLAKIKYKKIKLKVSPILH